MQPFFLLFSCENIPFSLLMAVYFLKFTAINANPISLCTLGFPRTDIRVKPKLAFKNPKTGSTSILRSHRFHLFLRLKASLSHILFGIPIFHYKITFYFYLLLPLYIRSAQDNRNSFHSRRL